MVVVSDSRSLLPMVGLIGGTRGKATISAMWERCCCKVVERQEVVGSNEYANRAGNKEQELV